MTFSTFQSLGEEEKLSLLISYMNTYEIGEIAAHWHKSAMDIFNIQMDLIRKKEYGMDSNHETKELSEMGKSLDMLTYDQLKALHSEDRARIIMHYHEMVEGKTGILADCLGIEKKRMYNLIYTSKQKLEELEKKRVDDMATRQKRNVDNEEEIDQLRLEMNMLDNDMTVELTGDGSGKKISNLLESVALAIENTGGMMTVELKIKRPE